MVWPAVGKRHFVPTMSQRPRRSEEEDREANRLSQERCRQKRAAEAKLLSDAQALGAQHLAYHMRLQLEAQFAQLRELQRHAAAAQDSDGQATRLAAEVERLKAQAAADRQAQQAAMAAAVEDLTAAREESARARAACDEVARRDNRHAHQQRALLEQALDKAAARERQLCLQLQALMRENPAAAGKRLSAQSAMGAVRAEALQAGATRLLLEQGARDPARQPEFSGCQPWRSTLPPATTKRARGAHMQGRFEQRLGSQPPPATTLEALPAGAQRPAEVLSGFLPDSSGCGLRYLGHGRWEPA